MLSALRALFPEGTDGGSNSELLTQESIIPHVTGYQ